MPAGSGALLNRKVAYQSHHKNLKVKKLDIFEELMSQTETLFYLIFSNYKPMGLAVCLKHWHSGLTFFIAYTNICPTDNRLSFLDSKFPQGRWVFIWCDCVTLLLCSSQRCQSRVLQYCSNCSILHSPPDSAAYRNCKLQWHYLWRNTTRILRTHIEYWLKD